MKNLSCNESADAYVVRTNINPHLYITLTHAGLYDREDTRLQQPVAAPVESGKDGGVDVTAVDALKIDKNVTNSSIIGK